MKPGRKKLNAMPFEGVSRIQIVRDHRDGPFSLFAEVCTYDGMKKDLMQMQLIKKYSIWCGLPAEIKSKFQQIFEMQFPRHDVFRFSLSYTSYTDQQLAALPESPYLLWLSARINADPALLSKFLNSWKIARMLGEEWNRMPQNEKKLWSAEYKKRLTAAPRRKKIDVELPTSFYAYYN